MKPESLSLRGCRSQAEALGKINTWLTGTLEAQLARFATDLLAG
jgi:hypothetical protein